MIRSSRSRRAAAIAAAALFAATLAGLAAARAHHPGGDEHGESPGWRIRALGARDTGSSVPRLHARAGRPPLLSWVERRPRGGHRLRVAELTAGGMGPARTVAEGDSFVVNWADFPQLCEFSPGRLAAAWLWRTGPDPHAYAVRVARSLDGGATWSAPATVHADLEGTEHGFVSMVPEAGGVRVLWLDGHQFRPGVEEGHAEMTLHARLLGADGALGPEEELDPRVCECCATGAVATASGMLVAYRDRDTAEVRDISLVRRENGRWTAPAPLSRDGWAIHGCPVNGPALDAAGDRVVAAWYTEGGGGPRVLAAFSEDGGRSFGAPLRVDGGAALGRVGVRLDGRGGALVTWIEGERARAAIRGRRVEPGGAAGPAFTIAATTGARASGVPQIAPDGDGFVVAYTEPADPAARRPSRVRLVRLAPESGAGRPLSGD